MNTPAIFTDSHGQGLAVPRHGAPDSRWRMFGVPLLLFVISAATVGLLQLAFGGLNGYDGYFHTRIAALYLDGSVQAAGSDFHWTMHSVWNGKFADKEWLFHILLAPLVAIFGDDPDGLTRAGVVGTSLAAGLVAMVAYLVLRARSVAWPSLWVLLLVVSSETFLYRLTLCRSYLLSISFALLGWHLIVTGRGFALAIVGMLYALSYTAPHLLFAMAVLWGLIGLSQRSLERWALNRPMLADRGSAWTEFAPAAWVFVGICAGWLLHPHSANLASSWLLQNVAVPLHGFGVHDVADWVASAAGYASDRELRVDDLGAELNAVDGRELFQGYVLAPLLMLLPWVLAVVSRVRIQREDVFAWACGGVFFVMMMASQRFAEYCFPFCILAAAMLVSKSLGSDGARSWLAFRPRFAKWAFWIVLIAVVLHYPLRALNVHRIMVMKGREPNALREPAELVNQHAPKGAAVFHAAWDSFPQLFHFAPDYRYVVGLDPTFLAARSPDLYRRMRELGRGEPTEAWKQRPAHQVIAEEFGMEYALINVKRESDLAVLLARAENIGDITLLGRTTGDSWRLYRLVPYVKAKSPKDGSGN